MRIRELTVRNLKILADQTFSFVRADGSVRKWTVLLGDNGVCKTTVLQAIVLASSGDKMARALVEDAADYVRQDRPERGAEILASFETRQAPLSIQMQVKENHHAFRGNDDAGRLDDVRDARTSGFFVVGYGTGRRLPRRGEVAIPRDPVADRVQGLFDASHDVLGLEWFRLLEERRLGCAFARILREVLLEPDPRGMPLFPSLLHADLLGRSGIEVMREQLRSGRIGVTSGGLGPMTLQPRLLGRGHQSVLAWLADLVGHALLDAGTDIDPKGLDGLVLLDEMDLYVHPTWQARLAPILQRTFPRMQFVTTARSALVAAQLPAARLIELFVDETGLIRHEDVLTASELRPRAAS